jgi:ppGpp synthetase/RelA/SpoT-type nucleotidyltranferase
MAFAKRWYSKGRIDRAGEELVSLPPSDRRMDEALEVINNWRSCHSYPLQIIKMTLLKRAKKISSKAIIAQRLKRLRSISIKLSDNPNMKLSQMQDIGGCRAILTNVGQVDRLVRIYEKSRITNPRGRPVWAGKSDYIANPKEDGYRSVHLIYKYQSTVHDKMPFNGQRIEIQIRTALQHSWATAVEIAQTFTGQAMKSKIKSANATWLRFFALMGSAIAMREKTPLVPNTPSDKAELVAEIRATVADQNILECLIGWGNTIKHLETQAATFQDAYTFLLTLDTAKHHLYIQPFKKDQMQEAESRYLIAEKESGEASQVVLVSVESLGVLSKAYPNYFADTTNFVLAVTQEIGNPK